MKVEEFINLNKGNMSVEECSLKFNILSMYAPSIVSNPRDAMTRFVPVFLHCERRASYGQAPW